MADVLDSSRARLPPSIAEMLPASPAALRATAADWLRTHADELRSLGAGFGMALVHVLIGLIIGAMISLREARAGESHGPLAIALFERARRLGEAFRRIVFAQVRISALNTLLTGIYLGVVLPLLGVHLPLVKTMILVTFIAGLLPVIGNLISNTVIVVVSLELLGGRSDRIARVPGAHPQARVLRQRAHRRHADPCARLGAADRHAGDGGGLRRPRPDRRADPLRVCEGRASPAVRLI